MVSWLINLILAYLLKCDEHGGTICLYIDDMIIFGTSIEVITLTKDFLNSKFEM